MLIGTIWINENKWSPFYKTVSLSCDVLKYGYTK